MGTRRTSARRGGPTSARPPAPPGATGLRAGSWSASVSATSPGPRRRPRRSAARPSSRGLERQRGSAGRAANFSNTVRQRRAGRGREHEHRQRHVRLHLRREQPVDDRARRLRLRGAAQDAGVLDLAEAAVGHHRRGRLRRLRVRGVDDLGRRAEAYDTTSGRLARTPPAVNSPS